MDAIQTTATEILVRLALGMITLLGAYGMYYLEKAIVKAKAQIVQIKDDSTRTLLTNALEDVNELVGVTVGAIEQTTAAALREAVKSGKADRESLVALSKQAFDTVKAAVTPEAQEAITKNLGSFDIYLKNLIENAVLKVKQETSYITLPESTTLTAGTSENTVPAADESTPTADAAQATQETTTTDAAPAAQADSNGSVEAVPSGQ